MIVTPRWGLSGWPTIGRATKVTPPLGLAGLCILEGGYHNGDSLGPVEMMYYREGITIIEHRQGLIGGVYEPKEMPWWRSPELVELV